VKVYTTEYWQEFKDYTILGKSIETIEKEIISIEDSHKNLMLSLLQNYIENFEKVFPKMDFNKLLKKDACKYCGITKSQLNELGAKHKLHKKNFRGWSLEIDRLDSNKEYTKANCVMACYWCNNAKTDEYTPDEFSKIAKSIHQVWMQRLNDH
jgi:5-methylcytosine-specific restriction endonuclease McrA